MVRIYLHSLLISSHSRSIWSPCYLKLIPTFADINSFTSKNFFLKIIILRYNFNLMCVSLHICTCPAVITIESRVENFKQVEVGVFKREYLMNKMD